MPLFTISLGINFPWNFLQKLGFPQFCAPTAAISKNYPFSFPKEKNSTRFTKGTPL